MKQARLRSAIKDAICTILMFVLILTWLYGLCFVIAWVHSGISIFNVLAVIVFVNVTFCILR